MSAEMSRNLLMAEQKTFMQLINSEDNIRIPNYQREYAQGRDDAEHGRRAELIRTNLVEALYKSLTDSTGREKLELDFIFGGTTVEGESGSSFNPVDGQQRLTILFLLHWYVFQRAKNADGLSKLKVKFKYSTRYTSEIFCRKLCDELASSMKFDLTSIADQIKDKAWYTGSMDCDPTVKSMLVVIDCIHERFQDYRDFSTLSAKLIDEACPIYFFCMNMQDILGSDSGIRDLYIKMNARGVPLTDYELFKADLQKKTPESGKRFDLMAEYLKKTDTEDTAAERVKIIGKFNNEYTNFFFTRIDDGVICSMEGDESTSKKQLFDVAMMNFINEIFRMNFFCAISECVSDRKYTNDNDKFKKMSGKELTAFLESHGERFFKAYWKEDKTFENIPDGVHRRIKDALVESFRSIIALLDFFSNEDLSSMYLDMPNAPEQKCCFSLLDLIKRLAIAPDIDKAIPYSDSLVRMALYDFIILALEKDCLSVESFNYWNRFVWKVFVNSNPDYKNFYEAIDTLKGYRRLLRKCDCLDSESINRAIGEWIEVGDEGIKLEGQDAFTSPAYLQLEEEKIKCSLICKDSAWKKTIKDAENYFSANGQLWFLFDLASDGSDCELKRFEKAFEIAKTILNEKKCLTSIPSPLFERSLLALTLIQPGFDNTDHLWHMSKSATATKKFVGGDFSRHLSHKFCNSSDSTEKDRYLITVELLKNMLDDEKLDVDHIAGWLQNGLKECMKGLDSLTSSDELWKHVFVKHDLQGKKVPGLDFKNGFEPNTWNDGCYSYTAVYTNKERRTDSGELLSFALAYELQQNGKMPHYHTSDNEYLDNNGFPNRYFSLDGKGDIGCKGGSFYARNDTTSEPELLGEFDEALAKLLM